MTSPSKRQDAINQAREVISVKNGRAALIKSNSRLCSNVSIFTEHYDETGETLILISKKETEGEAAQ